MCYHTLCKGLEPGLCHTPLVPRRVVFTACCQISQLLPSPSPQKSRRSPLAGHPSPHGIPIYLDPTSPIKSVLDRLPSLLRKFAAPIRAMHLSLRFCVVIRTQPSSKQMLLLNRTNPSLTPAFASAATAA